VAIILVCGVQNSGCQLAFDFLTKAGLSSARPSKREHYSPTDISSGICSAYGIDKEKSSSIGQVEPGKVWQALSTDLMLANLSEGDWGWADPNLVYTLEYWRDFDPQIKFVLVYSSPEQIVAEMADTGELSTESVEQALFDWQAINEELMRFYFKNKERCILLNSAFLSKDANLFVNYSRDQLGADLSDVESDAVAVPKRDPINNLIAPMLIKDAVDAFTLYQELESTADLPGSIVHSESGDLSSYSKHNILALQDKDDELLDPLNLAVKSWEHVNDLKRQGKQKDAELSQLKKERDTQKNETESLLSQIQKMQKESEAVSITSQEQIDTLEKTLKKQRKKNKRQKQELEKSARESDKQKEESQRLTLQLHQVQEDLEKTGIEKNNQTEENQLLILQLHQVQEELEQTFLNLQKNEQSQAELQAKIGQLTKERGALEKESGAFKNRLKALETEIGEHKANTKKMQGLEAKLDETAQESELQLLQLHQVQEELELYFQKYQEAIKSENKQENDTENDGDSAKIEKVIDLRQFVDGNNWHYAEHDGRWAGPGTQSALCIDKIDEGSYRFEIDVVDAMSPNILRGMKVAFNGKPLHFKWQGALASQWAPLAKLLKKTSPNYPLLLTGRVSITPADIKNGPKLSFNFPETISPAAHGSDDLRRLAVRVRKVRFVKI